MKPFFNRMLLLSAALLLAFGAIFFRMNIMMRQDSDRYAEKASSKSTKTLTLTGMRGTIYDTNLVPLAYDRRSYNVTFYRDPSRSGESDRFGYTRSIYQTILLVESNGKRTLDAEEFWLKKDEQGVWRFHSGATSETVEATREKQWRANFYLTNADEEELFGQLLEKYCILDVLREDLAGIYGEDAIAAVSDEKLIADNEDAIVKILAIWQASRMNSYNSRPVAIAYDVGFETVSEVEARSIDLMGMSAEESSERVYPQGTVACHVIGYVGKITSEDALATYRAKGYPTDALVGAAGLEASMEDQLSP